MKTKLLNQTHIYLLRIDPALNQYRQYEILAGNNKDQGYKIEYRWGRVGASRVRKLIKQYTSIGQWQTALNTNLQLRHKHGYCLLSLETDQRDDNSPMSERIKTLEIYRGRVGLQAELF